MWLANTCACCQTLLELDLAGDVQQPYECVVLQAAVQEAGSEHREHCPGCQEELLRLAAMDLGPAKGQSAQSKQRGGLLPASSLPLQPPVTPIPAAMLEAQSLPPPAASREFPPGSTHDQAAKQSSYSCMPYPELVRPEAAHRVRPSPPSVQAPVLQPFQPCQPPPAQQQPQPPPLQQSPQSPQEPKVECLTQPAAQGGTAAAPTASQPAPKPDGQNPKRKRKGMSKEATANICKVAKIVLQIASLFI